jgi:hypothetical protein
VRLVYDSKGLSGVMTARPEVAGVLHTQNVNEEVIDDKGFLFLDHQHMPLVL